MMWAIIHLFINGHCYNATQIHSRAVSVVEETLNKDIESVRKEKQTKSNEDALPRVLVVVLNKVQQNTRNKNKMTLNTNKPYFLKHGYQVTLAAADLQT